MTGYQGTPGGPSDPATPGPYCLRRCYCRSCPQYARQNAEADALRRAEYQRRLANEGQRAAAQERRARERRPRGATP